MPFQVWRFWDFSLVPRWAAVRGHLDILRTLIASDYEVVFAKDVLRLLFRHTSATDVVLSILQRRPEAYQVRDNIVRWATRAHDIKLVGFLVESCESTVDRLKRLHIVVLSAARHGHIELLKWVKRFLSSAMFVSPEINSTKVDPWRGALWTAMRCGHVDVTEWLLVQKHSETMELQRVLDHLVIASARCEVSVGVLRWLLMRYQDLGISIDAAAWIRACRIAHGRGHTQVLSILAQQLQPLDPC